jgi:hypothetical protein
MNAVNDEEKVLSSVFTYTTTFLHLVTEVHRKQKKVMHQLEV